MTADGKERVTRIFGSNRIGESGHLVIWASGHLVIDWFIDVAPNDQMTR
jgi:hypothetical protein